MMNTLSRMSVSTRLLVSAGTRRGLAITVLSGSKNTFMVKLGNREHIWKSTCFGNPVSVSRICDDKMLTHIMLSTFGYSVPKNKVFRFSEKEEALAWIGTTSKVVLKPVDAAHGNGVTVLPKGTQEVEAAWERALHDKKKRTHVMVEEYVEGEDYRLLVVGNTCIYVMHRIPPTVVGDGSLTVEQLIHRENTRPSRGAKAYDSFYSPIEMDDMLIQTISKVGMTLASVPKMGERVVLSLICNAGRGGTEYDITGDVSPSLLDDAVVLTERLGMDIVAIDVRTEDIRNIESLADVKILEMNATPGITLGTAGWVADAIWDALLSKYEKN